MSADFAWKSSRWGGIVFINAETIATLMLFVVWGTLFFSVSLLLVVFCFSVVGCFLFLCCWLFSVSLLLVIFCFSVVPKSNVWWECRQQHRGRSLSFFSFSVIVCFCYCFCYCYCYCFLLLLSLLLLFVEIHRPVRLSSTAQRPQRLRCFTPTAKAWRLLRNVTFSFIIYQLLIFKYNQQTTVNKYI